VFGNQRWTIKDPEICGGGGDGGVEIVVLDGDDDDDSLVEMRGSSVSSNT
jgi:hypothetical protein